MVLSHVGGNLLKPLFDKILIANRGEIACRVMRTAKKLNIKTVAVFSEADRGSLHVRMADEAFCIGPPASKQSYLVKEKIIDVAKRSGAQAIHPGYGFLSENAEFADYCKKQGVVFIGPPAQAIRDMGSKSESKIIMTRAGVPVVPGYHGEDQSIEKLKHEANKIGYPVLIKAVMGGGGKGMRIVHSQKDFEDMLQSSKNEARNSFNDDKVLIEKYLVKPRHVEVQVFGDTLGNYVYLFERDCSVQRRHQKVLEEAPAPGLSNDKRKELGQKAVAAAKAVGYYGAGTVEFIMDEDETFYFMEMNTRLQVEHPVTEMITKTDLVEWQIRVASGNPLPITQEHLKLHGHSIEARIYAENPRNNFLPDTGKLYHLSTPIPKGEDKMRVETGVLQGDEVSVYYDPMIAKLVVWEETREKALKSLVNALEEYKVVGPKTNIQFLIDAASHSDFAKANVDTGFIKRNEADLLKTLPPASGEAITQVVLSQLLNELIVYKKEFPNNKDTHSPMKALSGWRMNDRHTRTLKYKDGESKIDVLVTYNEDDSFSLQISSNGKLVNKYEKVTGHLKENGHLTAEIDGHRVNGTVVEMDGFLYYFSGSERGVLEARKPEYLSKGSVNEGSVLTPMPCKITKVMVKPGDHVKKDQPLMTLEAMKMEHLIKAPADGIVAKIRFKEGDLVGEKQLLITFQDDKEKK